MRVNTKRLWDDLEQLGVIGRHPEDGSVTRIAFSPEDMQGREFLKGLMHSAGLEVEQDAFGNIIGRLRGCHDMPAIAVGSHIDTVPRGGRFDGSLGVLAGLECARIFKESDYPLRRPLEIISFSDEEGFKFGRGTLGSRAMSGFLNPDDLNILKDRDGQTLRQVLIELGFQSDHLTPRYKTPRLFSYVELHIEQGPVLESLNLPIGIVEVIVGILRFQLRFEGEANHAGTTPMAYRKDALTVAASIVTALRDLVLKHQEEMVGTVGRFEVWPGASNIIPGSVLMTIELRGPRLVALEEVANEILHFAHHQSDQTGVSCAANETARIEPTLMNRQVTDVIETACHNAGVSYRRMNSGAGHDAIWMARICPAGMLFVPSSGGNSHNSKEDTSEYHVELGTQVLLQTILELDRKEPLE